MSRLRLVVATIGIMFGLFMASMEVTVVATAMPTIVSELGGLAVYSWVFTAYMLASTTTVPIYGKLSDIYGRRPIYMIAMGLFLTGSLLSGGSQSMAQLIGARALQGLGAGGLIPLALTMIGDMFSAAQRAKMVGLFSGVWGVSSVVGPLLGGFLVDQVSWPWVFYVNLVPGALAGLLVWWAWQDEPDEVGAKKPTIDYPGAVLLTLSVVVLLLGLFELTTPRGWLLMGLAVMLFAGLAWAERRAVDPILPLLLFKKRLFSIACIHGILAGWALFGSIAFVPLFVQSVLGTSATAAGGTITSLILGWVIASVIGGRIVLVLNYRSLTIFGGMMVAGGAFLLSRVGPEASRSAIIVYLAMMGVGMGVTIPIFLIAVQSSVSRRVMGSATSFLQFSRTIGGALGVNIMGVVLSLGLASGLMSAGLDPATVSVDSLLNPVPGEVANAALIGSLRTVLTEAIRGTFFTVFAAALLALVVTLLTPQGHITQLDTSRRPDVKMETESQPVPGGR